MSKLSNKILRKIKKDKVTPKSRQYFMLMHTLLGTAILTSIIIGSMAVAIVIRHFTVTDWELARQFAGGHVQSFFMLMPYIWIIFIGLTIFLADILFKHTKKGYKIEPWKLVAGSIAISIILGGLFYVVKADKPIEEGLRQNLRPYEQWENRRNQMFAAPERGVLAGEIIEVNSDEEWIIIDFKGQKWFVDISDTMMRKDIPFKTGMRVGMIGEMLDKDHFKAKRIGPWRKEMNSRAIDMK
ncbi:MAG TPA: hypothetical protein ENL10_03565, partial [Candidatus Cloacimonetes bacterium]|nr:hypothetical protein [Candidatus Cloacimonadota bacterium]